MMTGTKSDIEKFDGKNDFALWQVRMKALLEQQGLAAEGEGVSNLTSGIMSSGSRVLWLTRIDQEEVVVAWFFWKEQEGSILFGLPGSRQQKFLALRFFYVKEQHGIDRLNIEKLDENIIQKHGGSKQVGFKQLGPGVETGVHEVHVEKRVWFEVELQGAQGDREAGVFQVSNDDTAVAQRWLEDKQPEEKTNTNWSGKGISDWVEDQDGSSTYSWDTVKGIVSNKLWRLDDVTSKVLQGDEFEVEPQESHTFKGATLSMGTIQYREDSNEVAFAVAAVEKIYTHESLTFNDTVAYECSATVARNAVTTVMAITGSLQQGHSILSLEGSLSRDCDVEKNGKWSCIYAVGSQEYQMVCTRLDIASTNVGMLDKFDRGLQTYRFFVDFDYVIAAYMTLTEAAKESIWLKGLAIESGFVLKIAAGIATGALSKAIPGSRCGPVILTKNQWDLVNVSVDGVMNKWDLDLGNMGGLQVGVFQVASLSEGILLEAKLLSIREFGLEEEENTHTNQGMSLDYQ
ncbi:hypothetical protein Tco_0778411, partial [Tanacetum coccineum]